MNGKELMVYILENDLLDKPMLDEDGIPIWLMTVAEAATIFDVDSYTIRTWIIEGKLKYEFVNGRYHIYRNAKDPREEKKDEQELIN